MIKKIIKIIFSAFFIALIPYVLLSCDNQIEEIKDASSYIVSLDYNDGSEIVNLSVNENEKIECPNVKPRDGYEFKGWYDGDILFDFNSIINKDILLKAKWRADSNISFWTFESPQDYDIETEYDDSYFALDSNQYNKDLAMFSFYQSVINDGGIKIVKFLKFYGFDDIYQLKENDPSYDNVLYTLAHKRIENYDIINLSIRGFNYNKEWAGNFDLGESGNHKDFMKAANILYSKLKEYVNCYSSNIKILINGYSRAGAISNGLAYLMIEDTNKIVLDNNLYVYTFEAPAPLIEENANSYTNVYNIFNSADIVPHILPSEFGFRRCGIDIDINDNKIDALVDNYNFELALPKYREVDSKTLGIAKIDSRFPNAFLKLLLNYEASSEEYEKYEMNDRYKFVNNACNKLSYIIEKIFSLSPSTRNLLINDLKNNASEYINYLTNPAALIEYLKTYFDIDNINYDDNKLLESTEFAIGLLFYNSNLNTLVIFYLNNIKRMIYQHLPIYNYLYLVNYNQMIQ